MQRSGIGDGGDDFRRFERDGWERTSATYDEVIGRPITSRAAGPLLDAAGVGPGSSVLDAASGPGYVATAAVARGADATGVDVAAPGARWLSSCASSGRAGASLSRPTPPPAARLSSAW